VANPKCLISKKILTLIQEAGKSHRFDELKSIYSNQAKKFRRDCFLSYRGARQHGFHPAAQISTDPMKLLIGFRSPGTLTIESSIFAKSSN